MASKQVWVPIKNRVQSELVKRGHCVGCTRSLIDAERKNIASDPSKELVTCQCRRMYIYDKQLNHYRRANLDEIHSGAT